MSGVVPDSFFMLAIKHGEHPQVNCGPYSSFSAAAEVSMDYVHVALALNGIEVEPGAVIRTRVLECTLIEGGVQIISERASDTSKNY